MPWIAETMENGFNLATGCQVIIADQLEGYGLQKFIALKHCKPRKLVRQLPTQTLLSRTTLKAMK